MKKQLVRQVLFLSVALAIGLFALSQALHEDVYASGECSTECVCNGVCAGYTGTKSCTDDELCNGQSGSPTNCAEYCAITRH